MSIDITALDQLPESGPMAGLSELAELGLAECGTGFTCLWTCGLTCRGNTNFS